MKVQQQINQKSFLSQRGFIYEKQKLIKEVVIPYQYSVLNDSAKDNTEKSHVIQNFINAGKVLAGEIITDGFYGMVFQDSDVAKWIEAAAYSLSIFPDKELEACVDKLIEIIAKAQDSDGYLNTYFTIKDQDKRWTNTLEAHELYCAGHMMEAACAYYESTGKTKLLQIMEKNADCIYKNFMEGDDFIKESFPGHPEVELALMKMYRVRNNNKYFELAKHFIDVRGLDPNHFEKERMRRNWTVWGSDGKDTIYNQANLPLRQMTDARGHAVRGVYLYTAMADISSEIQDEELQAACKRLWDSITKRQMYITGGIGSTVLGEAFSVDYDLPNDTAYCETCASIGLIFFASKMLELEVKGDYADVMERAFYNTVLAGMQEDGKKFFYVNPLEVIPEISEKAQTHKHTLTSRPSWFACACCPPNVARFISSFGKYAYGENENTAFAHLYAQGIVNFNNGITLECQTDFPEDFTITYKIKKLKTKEANFAIRLPKWSKEYKIIHTDKNKNEKLNINQEDNFNKIENAYIYLSIAEGDNICLTLDEKPYIVYPSPKIPDLSGQVAICKGPLVFCAEGIDNQGEILNFSIDSEKFKKEKANFENKANFLSIPAYRESQKMDLYSQDEPEYIPQNIKMIPYYKWANRGISQMKIWFPKR